MLTVGHIERFNPAIRELRRRLDAGELGRIFQISATRLGPFPARIRDVGVVVDLAPHDLDVMRYLLGSEPIRIYAETERRIHTEHEDLFNGIIEVRERGGRRPRHQLADADEAANPDRHRRARHVRRRLHRAGPRLLREPGRGPDWQNRGRRLGAPITSVAEGEMTRRSIRREEPLAVELGEFARAVRDGGPPPVDPHDAMVALLLARKMVESARHRPGDRRTRRSSRGAGVRIAVVGLGHIGLPLAVQYASRGHDVLGVDIDARIVETLNRGESPHRDEQALVERVPELVAAGRLRATTWTDPAGRPRAPRWSS